MEIYSLRPLKNKSDWIDAVGAKNYQSGYSAFETHQKWNSVSELLPEPLNSLLRRSGIPTFASIKPEFIIAEHAVFLDTFRTPSRTDIMAFCSNADKGRVVIAVEAKCNEPFAERIYRWIRTPEAPTGRIQHKLFEEQQGKVERKLKRLEFLNQVLGTTIDPLSELRYQLLHRTASAIIEARNIRAEAAVVVIQAFTLSVENFFDFGDFCDVLGVTGASKNRVLGAYFAPFAESIPIYFLYLQDRPSTYQVRLFT